MIYWHLNFECPISSCVTYICVNELSHHKFIMSSVRHQAIIRTNDGWLLVGPYKQTERNSSQNLNISFTKCNGKCSQQNTISFGLSALIVIDIEIIQIKLQNFLSINAITSAPAKDYFRLALLAHWPLTWKSYKSNLKHFFSGNASASTLWKI